VLGGRQTVLGEPVSLAALGIVPGDAHALAATATDGLDHHGVGYLVGQLDTVVLVADKNVKARNDVDLGLGSDLLAALLVSQEL
jgi:hypothetical protein